MERTGSPNPSRLVLCLAGAIVITGTIGGCSGEWYQRRADRQVERILRERERGTLGYVPAPEAPPVTGPVGPSREAREKVPETLIPAGGTSPIEPIDEQVPFGPTGPVLLDPAEAAATLAQHPDDELGEEAVGQLVDESLRLGPVAPGPRPMSLDLFESLAYGVQHSRDYMDQLDDLYLAALDVTSERHLFSPRPFARTTLLVDGSQAANDYESALRATQSIGVRQQLPYGGEVVAEALVGFVNTLRGNLEGGEDATVAVSASIPLLRGAGWVNLEPLIQSERDLIYQVREFEAFRRSFAVTVADQYFSLLSQRQQIANAIQNLQNTRNLSERTQALYAAGILRFAEVQRALQQQLTAENRLIEAQVRYQNSIDSFKLLLGMPIEQPLDVVPSELEVVVPDMTVEAATEVAHQYRLDVQTAEDRVEDAQRAVAVAQNLLLPDLDLIGQAQLGNEAGDPARRLDEDTAEYSAGIELDWPLDRTIERNAYRRALVQLEQSRRNLSELLDAAAIDARQALRGIRSAQQSLRIQRNAIELALRRLENANELLRQGTADSEDVVDAQNDLLEAQNEYEEAQAELQTQVLEFLRDTGTLRVAPDAGSLGEALDRPVLVNSTRAER